MLHGVFDPRTIKLSLEAKTKDTVFGVIPGA
jgi:hypothetical protein